MKVNCDIIQDLMPSYIDEVCSEATKQCVEEHLAECDSCRSMEKLYRENAFSGKALEEKQIDGLKRLKAKLKSQHIFCVVLLALVLVSGVITFFVDTHIAGVSIFVMATVCMVAVWFLGSNRGELTKMSKKDYVITLVSAVLMVYGFGILYYCVNICRSGKLPFSMSERQFGLFLHWQWGIIFALQLVIMVYMIVHMFRKKVDLRATLCVNITGLFMAVDYATLQYVLMCSIEEFLQIAVVRTAMLAVMGIVGAVVMAIIAKKRQ